MSVPACGGRETRGVREKGLTTRGDDQREKQRRKEEKELRCIVGFVEDDDE
jgi:hypothetical protein